MSDCRVLQFWFDFHTIFNKIGLYKTVSRCALAVEWMSVAWLDLICRYKLNTYYLGLGTFLKAMLSSHYRTPLRSLISIFFSCVVQLNLAGYLFL